MYIHVQHFHHFTKRLFADFRFIFVNIRVNDSYVTFCQQYVELIFRFILIDYIIGITCAIILAIKKKIMWSKLKAGLTNQVVYISNGLHLYIVKNNVVILPHIQCELRLHSFK